MPKVWFVTGSSRGLGRAIVETALEAGDQVVATARESARLDDLVARHGDRILPLTLDVTSDDDVRSAVREGLEAFGRYDVVVNNAGYGDIASVEDVTLDAFRAQIDTNFYGVVQVTKAVLPALRLQGFGHIFQVSSVGGRVGSAGLSAYQSAKWAVGGFSTVLAQEVAPLGIKVTVLEPGGMRTDWAGSSMTIPPVSEPYQQTVGTFADMIRGSSTSNSAESDPVKVAHVVHDLAGRQDAPVRIVLGAQAYEIAQAASRAITESDEKWREVSESVSD
ncbi:SDR family NAD(P)-dependent oxidoreductase [Streptomyces sp. NBC_01571]|uniref:SDR family NAD(P)-dependent oxidoreductase n=1 Tax=Streptomyces sp. NBC_01571 TaxID=2975883 RepID=UPI002250237B|nr:SDR family NAD(P)-dependent oxidoreductase [Streptomyces sp. NBC_01571]MCX4580064.1 SDR family NAD(P)-dependent oxidoreductase [Streptomyces sp. NBC_01571]